MGVPAKITDHPSEALDRLLEQYRGKALLEGVLRVLNVHTQKIEDALFQLYTDRWLAAPDYTLLSTNTGTNSTAFLTSFTSTKAGRLYVVNLLTTDGGGVGNDDGFVTLTSAGMTWTRIATVRGLNGNTARVDVFAGMPTEDNTDQINISYGAVNVDQAAWQVYEWTGVDQGGVNGAGAIVQVLTAGGSGVTSLSVDATTAGAGVAAVLLGKNNGGDVITFTGTESSKDSNGWLTSTRLRGSVGTITANGIAGASAGLIVLMLKPASGGFAYGSQLDVLGRVVGQLREAAADPDYRTRIRARARANRSHGAIEDILEVFQILLPSTVLQFVQEWPAAFRLDLGQLSTVNAALVPMLARFLADTRLGGVGGYLRWQEDTDGNSLYTGVTAFLNGSHSAGVTTLTILDPPGNASFPSSGSLLLDEGTATQETVTYTGKTATTFTGVSATTQIHGDKTSVALVGSTGLGLGRGTRLSALANAGATTLSADTTGFPASGTLILDLGTSTQETVTYTGTTGSAFTGVSATVYAHIPTTTVHLEGSFGKLAGALLP